MGGKVSGTVLIVKDIHLTMDQKEEIAILAS